MLVRMTRAASRTAPAEPPRRTSHRRGLLTVGGPALVAAALLAIPGALVPSTTHASTAASAGGGGPGTIAYVQERGNAAFIFNMRADGSEKRQLTTTGADFEPSISAHGGRIAFTRRNFGLGTQRAEIFVMSSDGSHQRQLTHGSIAPPGAEPTFNLDPAFSPNGKRIAYLSGYEAGEDDYSRLVTIRSDGTGVRTLTGPGLFCHGIDYSPSGKRILFARLNRDDACQIFEERTDGSGLRRLTRRDSQQPAFSPTGNRIAFSGFRHHVAQIFTMRPNGTHVRQLTHGQAGGFDPSFSPRGTKIAFRRNRNSQVYVMRANGKHVHELTRRPHTHIQPDWGVRR
jgi:TolB protein